MRDIIFIGMEEWDEVWRRSQNLAARLSRRAPDHKILFVAPPVNLSGALGDAQIGHVLRNLRPDEPHAVPGLPNIFVFQPLKVLPNSLTVGRLVNQTLARKQIRQAARAVGITKPLLWVKPHYAAHMLGRMGERAVVYDVGDDWPSFYPAGGQRERAIAEDEFLTRRASAVIVVSEVLLQKKRALRKVVHLIPNGADPEHYASVSDPDTVPHPLSETWKHPVIGHTGTIHGDRTDIDLVLAVARRFPQSTIALVGPIDLEPETLRALQAEPNIKMTDAVPYKDLPSIMKAFDVCFVPTKVTPFTESQNPLKLFEYLAAGLPIVSTPISGFRDFPELVHLAREEDEFVEQIQRALSEEPGMMELRRQAVEDQTWDCRVDDILQVLAEASKR